MDFPYFTKLPLELQIEVWRHALHAESQERVVLLHDTHVIPRPSLISPFLSVDRISRIEALRFYPVALKVVDLPKFVAPSLPKTGPRRLRYVLRQERMLSKFERRLDGLVPHLASRGTVRLSPARDTFIIGLDFAPQYAKKTLTHLSRGPGDDGGRPGRPIAERLDRPTAAQAIRHAVLAEWDRYGGWRPHVDVEAEYAREAAERLWDRATFGGCTTFQHLWLWERGPAGGLRMLGDYAACARHLMRVLDDPGNARGERGRLDIRSWTPVEGRDGSGLVVSRVYGPEERRGARAVEQMPRNGW